MRTLITLTLLTSAAFVFGDPEPQASRLVSPTMKVEASKKRPERKPRPRPERVAKPAAPKAAKATAPDASKLPAAQKAPAPAKVVIATPDPLKSELAALTAENALAAEREKKSSAKLREQVAKLKLEKEHLAETIAIKDLERKSKQIDSLLKHETEKEQLIQQAAIAKARADKIASDLKAKQAEWLAKTAKLEAEMKEIEITDKRNGYANAKPVYLESPLKKDGTLVISDRRISLNGPITSRTADNVTTRINYFNNKDPKLPIFIVIGDSPGGSVMSGYRILKSMEGSDAPVYVVVKSFAASMAATLTTLAEKSYAYPNAVILHHQMSMTLFGRLNLTQQKELYGEAQRWWNRLAKPISDKMGITTDEFIKRMYQRSSSGDWTEFADEAVKLNWVDHTVERIHETALVRDPDAKSTPTVVVRPSAEHGLAEDLDEEGHPVMYLPRTNPRDFYFLYNPDGYYRLR